MIDNIEYSHAFQPVIDIDANEIISYEVLLRGKNNEPPGFIFNQIPDGSLMDFDHVNRKSAIKLATDLGLSCSLNLNFTPGSILHADGKYTEETINTAQEHGILAKNLIFEITENEAIKRSDGLIDSLSIIRRAGVVIAIDDFGSGHAGLNLLVDVHPDLIKLDMHLIRGISKSGPKQAIVKAIISACIDLGIDVLAEGVETDEELSFLRNNGIFLYQGYLFAKPGFECLPTVTYKMHSIQKRPPMPDHLIL